MDHAEAVWRIRAASRRTFDRACAAVVQPRWDRGSLATSLAPLPELVPLRRALAASDWGAAHAAVTRYLVDAPQRFVIGPGSRDQLARSILREFPGSGRE